MKGSRGVHGAAAGVEHGASLSLSLFQREARPRSAVPPRHSHANIQLPWLKWWSPFWSTGHAPLLSRPDLQPAAKNRTPTRAPRRQRRKVLFTEK